MGSYLCKIAIMTMTTGLFLAGVCFSAEPQTGASESRAKSASTVAPDKKGENKEKENKELAIGIIGGMHKMVREERIAALADIDRQRRETLAYLTEERRTVMDELRKEMVRTTEVLQSERRTTIVEMEIMGNRIVDNAMTQSKELIDHFFLRTVQLLGAAILVLCIIGFVCYRYAIGRTDRSKTAAP